MNLLNVIGGAAQGFLMGGPVGAGLGAIAGATTSGSGVGSPQVNGAISSTASALGNVQMTAGQTGYLNQTQIEQQQQLNFQLAVQQQADTFNDVTTEKSEIMRESNELRNVAMEQRKADNEVTKEFIKSIG